MNGDAFPHEFFVLARGQVPFLKAFGSAVDPDQPAAGIEFFHVPADGRFRDTEKIRQFPGFTNPWASVISTIRSYRLSASIINLSFSQYNP